MKKPKFPRMMLPPNKVVPSGKIYVRKEEREFMKDVGRCLLKDRRKRESIMKTMTPEARVHIQALEDIMSQNEDKFLTAFGFTEEELDQRKEN